MTTYISSGGEIEEERDDGTGAEGALTAATEAIIRAFSFLGTLSRTGLAITSSLKKPKNEILSLLKLRYDKEKLVH